MSTMPVHEPACLDVDGAIDLVIEGRPRDVGTITVARMLPAPRHRMVGPFVFLDHMGPIDLAPGVGFDIRPHPHIGLSTVTYFYAGENVHRDSLGNVRVNRPGDINLMTAGRGIVHSERADPGFRATGGHLHAVQIWLGLPLDHEDDPPSFEHHPAATLPAIAPGAGARGHVLMGSAFGAVSPIRHPSQPLLVDLELEARATVDVPAEPVERGVFVISGEVAIGSDALAASRLAVLKAGKPARVVANAASRLLLLGGPTLGPRVLYWNFVASSQDRIDRAKQAWRAREFPGIPTDDQEFIPLPD